MRKKLLATLLSALACACAFAILAFTGCQNDEPKQDGAYYLSVLESGKWTDYKSDADIPTDKKFVKDGEAYKLTVDLDEGASVKIAQVGTDKTYGGNEIFSANTQLTKGTDNAISVGASGTYDLTLDAGAGEITYKFTPKATPATVVSVEIDDAEDIDLAIGGTKQLTATATLSDDSTVTTGITWKSADTSVATVENGLVTAAATGSTTVIAKHGSVESDPVVVTVSDEGTVILSETSLNLAVNEERTLTYTVTGPAVAGEWVSTDEDVATVDQTGKVTALKAGTATIRLSYTPKAGATPKFAECEVTVNVPVTNITLNNNAINVAMESTANLTVGIVPANATNQNYTYAISDGGEAYISVEKDGNTLTITPVALGTATITVTSEDGNYTADCEVTVVAAGTVTANISDSSITLNKTGVKNTKTLTVEVDGDTASAVVWSSSNTGVATVANSGNDGVVTAVAHGTTVITAAITTAGGQSIEKTCTVRVAPGHFFLYGDIGDKTWTVELATLEAQKMVFTDNNDGTYTLTYDLPEGKNFRIGDDDGFGTTWVSLNYSHLVVDNKLPSGKYLEKADQADLNLRATLAGTFTLTIDLNGATPKITTVCDAIAVTGIAIEADNGTLTAGDATKNSAVITLTVYPDGENAATYTQDDVVWTYDETKLTAVKGENTLTVTVIDGTPKGSITVTCEVKRKTATVNLAITVAGAPEVLPASVEFGQTSYAQNVNGTGGWTCNVSASVKPANADNPNVTYSGSAGITVDAATGAVTATKAGTYTVTATAAGDNSVYATTTVTFYSDTLYVNVYSGDSWTVVSDLANYTFTGDNNHKIFTLKAVLDNGCHLVILYKQPDANEWNNEFPAHGNATFEGNSVAEIKSNRYKITGETGVYTITVDLSTAAPVVKIVRDGDTPSFTAKLSDGSTDVTVTVASPDKNRWTMELEEVAFEADKVYTIQLLKGTDVVATVNSVANFDGDAKNSFANGTNGFTCTTAGDYNVTVECDADGNATVSVFVAKTYPYQLLINDKKVNGITLSPETEGEGQYTLYFSSDVPAWQALKFTVRSLDGTKSAKAEWATDFTAQGGLIEYTNKSADDKWLYKSIHEKWNSLQSNNAGTMYGKIVFNVSASGDITIVSLTTADSLEDLTA